MKIQLIIDLDPNCPDSVTEQACNAVEALHGVLKVTPHAEFECTVCHVMGFYEESRMCRRCISDVLNRRS